jgi:hypothetical protein
MPGELEIHLQPKQEQLHELLRAVGPDVPKVIGGGGAKGGGKSRGFRNIALLLAEELGRLYPGIVITIVRRVFDDLKKNHIDPLFTNYPELSQFYRSGDRELIIKAAGCNAKIAFAYAETEDDVKRKFLGGYESAIILVDEAQQFSEQELQWIQTACRWTSGAGVPPGLCKMGLFFNPGGKGSTFLRRVFWLRQFTEKERPGDYAFVHIFGWDNYEWFRGQIDIDEEAFYELDSDTRFRMFISETSEGRKYDAFPKSIRAGYLLGSFDHFEGQYFAGVWDERINVLTAAQCEQIIQPWWTRWMAQDWGFGDHDAHGWFASGKMSPTDWMRHFGGKVEYPMDVVILYRENIISDRAEADLAQDIVSLTPEPERKMIQRFFLSQDAFGQKAKQAGSHTVGEAFGKIMNRHGLPTPETANQDRVNGWRFMFNCLRQGNLRGQDIPYERTKEGPAFFVSAQCPQVIDSIPMAVRADDNIEDVMRVAGVLWEDCTDCVRYGLHSMLNPKVKAPLDVRRLEEYNRYEDPTNRAIRMKEFELVNSQKRRTTRRGSFRMI